MAAVSEEAVDTSLGGEDTSLGGEDTSLGGEDTSLGGEDTVLDPLIENATSRFKDEFSDELDCDATREGNSEEGDGDEIEEGEGENGDDNENVDEENIQTVDTDDKDSLEEDQDTEGDDMNDAEEIEAGDSLEETEFVEGEAEGVDEEGETELVEGDPLVEEGDPLVEEEEGDPLEAEADPLMDGDMGEDMEEMEMEGEEGDMGEEEEMNGLEHTLDESDVQNHIGEEGGPGLAGTKRKSSEQETPVRKSSRIKLLDDIRKEKEVVKSVHDKQHEKTKMLQKPTERPTRISDEEAEQSDNEKDDYKEEVTETKIQGDPTKAPGVGAARKIDPDFLLPFQFGWTREVVVKPVKSGPQQLDVFYWPPKDGEDYGPRNREARRKRRSKVDIEKYFDEFKHKSLSVNNFTFVRRPLELNNEAYEIVRHSKPSLETRSDKRTRAASVRYKEVAEHEGLLSGSSSEEDQEEVEDITDFDQGLPLSLQVIQRTTPFREESNKRKKFPDRERCVTPPNAEEISWTLLDDDPLGIYTELGGRSSPATPPPLRAVRLTSQNTVDSAHNKLQEIKNNLVDPLIRVRENNKDIELKENLASHDTAIKKYKNLRLPSLNFSRGLPGKHPGGVPRLSSNNRQPPSRQVGRPSGAPPGVVKVKLPILANNGKRPSVELVMLTNGKYQPIKFTNNRQVTESVPKRLFDQANNMKKTLYQRSVQVPKIGSKPVFVAVNPSQHGYKPFLNNVQSAAAKKQNKNQPPSSEQVSILVTPAQGGNNVLLNVPKSVALKVKKGTTLSFSASSDQKYIVEDAKMHPPVGKKAVSQPPPPPMRRPLPNLPAGVSIRPISRPNGRQVNRGPPSGRSQPRPMKPAKKNAPPPPLVDLTDFSPCSPFCPGVTGIPELECCSCHSLFHPKCVGIPQSMVTQIRSQFKCQSCRNRPGTSTIQVIELD